MQYRPRHAEKKVLEYGRYFKVVLVTGARQVGKSTLLAHLFPEYKTIVFDPLQDRYGARSDPDLFLQNFPPPLVLDEFQYVPELLSAIKRRVDRTEDKGQYFLTGSQNPAMLRSVAESMAGRVGIIQLETMTPLELAGFGADRGWLPAYLERPEALLEEAPEPLVELDPLPRALWRGGMPGLLDLPDEMAPEYLRGYVLTYLERDVRNMSDIRDLGQFDRFLGLNAALTAQEINDHQLGREIAVSPPTARRWRELLIHSYQWRELQPYHGNTIKRVSGKRKGYLSDTGLACYLQRLSTPGALPVSPLFGALFESWVVNSIQQQFIHFSAPPQPYHWRTAGGAEVDVVLEYNGRLYPIEVKCKSLPDRRDARGLRAFRQTYGEQRVMTGLIVHAGEETYRINEETIAFPWKGRV